MSLQESFDSTYVCLDRYCPKVFDPHTNVVMCRCYQTQSVSHPSSYAIQSSYGRRISSPPSYPTSLSYGDSQTVPQSACSSYLGYSSGSDAYGMYPNVFSQLSPTNMSNPDLSMYGSYVQSTQMDQILRSQVADFWNYQHLSNQVNGSDIPATKQSTKLLKTWIREHKKNPYPTKTEKVMLAFATRMTMTQISNWFANARRRMKQQKDKGNLSDSAISDISDDDDKSSVCKSPALPANVNMHKHTTKDEFFSLSDTNVTEYLRESERITKPLIIDETESRSTMQSASVKPETNNDDSTDKKVQLPLSVLTEVQTPPMPVKSKIWSVSSILG